MNWFYDILVSSINILFDFVITVVILLYFAEGGRKEFDGIEKIERHKSSHGRSLWGIVKIIKYGFEYCEELKLEAWNWLWGY